MKNPFESFTGKRQEQVDPIERFGTEAERLDKNLPKIDQLTQERRQEVIGAIKDFFSAPIMSTLLWFDVIATAGKSAMDVSNAGQLDANSAMQVAQDLAGGARFVIDVALLKLCWLAIKATWRRNP